MVDREHSRTGTRAAARTRPSRPRRRAPYVAVCVFPENLNADLIARVVAAVAAANVALGAAGAD